MIKYAFYIHYTKQANIYVNLQPLILLLNNKKRKYKTLKYKRLMIDPKKIELLNSVIENYFKQNETATIIPVKKLMPEFITAGIFTKDIKKGMPIRKIIRELDINKQLDLIPFIHADRQEQDTYWYFIPKDATAPTTSYKQEESKTDKKAHLKNDEAYIIDLCDTLLEKKAYRKKKFEFLQGDYHKDGESKTKIPVDAYYEDLSLAILYQGNYSPSETSNKKEDRLTVSGMNRADQRERYHKRKILALPKNGIKVINVSYNNFPYDDEFKIERDTDRDTETLKDLLKDFL